MTTLYLANQAGAHMSGTGQVYFDALPLYRAWGIYLCENQAVAEDRRKSTGPLVVTLGGNEWRQVGRHEFTDQVGINPAQMLPEHLQHALWGLAEIEPAEGENMEADVWPPLMQILQRSLRKITQEDFDAIFSQIESGRFSFMRGETMIYTVETAIDESALLDWDAKLSEQTALVQGCLHRHGLTAKLGDGINQEIITPLPKLGELTDEDVYGVLTVMEPSPRYADGRADQRTASLRLLAAGIPGLRMRDHYSRPQDGWELGMPVTQDVILFDVEKIRITHRDGVPLTDTQAREALENVQITTGVSPDVFADLLEPESGESENPRQIL